MEHYYTVKRPKAKEPLLKREQAKFCDRESNCPEERALREHVLD